jgi:alpha-amylase
MPRQFSLFDCPLVYNFSHASKTESADLRKIFDGTLVQSKPINAVTLVQNHDTQPGQALQAPVEDFFKPLAYALILLRLEGYPAIFYGDLYGISGPDGFKGPSCGDQLGDLILARKLYAYGEEDSYFDFPTCLGWVRRGTWDRKDGCAVVLSNAGPGEKRMFVGELHKGEIWTDVVWSVVYSVNGSWDGVIVRLRLALMGLVILFVGKLPLVFLSIKMLKGGISLGNGILLTHGS